MTAEFSALDFSALAIETSTEACSVAACSGDQFSIREYASSQTGSRHVFQLIDEILDRAGTVRGSRTSGAICTSLSGSVWVMHT